MYGLESLNATPNQVLPPFQTPLPKYPVEPPIGTDDLDGFLAA
jgi:hypothetical protein